ncbi:anaerobic ribonucleoside-triphosphate reductase activating protein [Candidatus Nomurabacteria bacterium]|nr:anaerobic ribonucleoside-triphosphate reductase activating protein [Candidatus Kaiserbacteria bacterium]MCB9814139.1 anaerobic ribonucleoside-triphosphate reductase activating protein [Candidatus Nomurabacteria bacterium]
MKLGGLQQCSLIDYPGHICAVVFTIGCNFHCPYCHNPELVNETAEEIDVEEFFSFLKKRVGLLDGVTVTGGEPTVHTDLLQFIGRIKELGFKVKLDSNGTNPDMLKEAVAANLIDYIAMDIKSPLARYSETVARPTDVASIKASIDWLRSGTVPYEFRTTVIKSFLSTDDFHIIGQEIAGAKNYYLQKFIPTKLLNPSFLKKTTYSDDEFVTIAEIMKQYVETCQIR